MDATASSYSIARKDGFYIGGEWRAAKGTGSFEIISPFDEKVVDRTAAASAEDVGDAVRAARNAFDNGPWPTMRGGERREALHRIADLLDRRREEIAHVTTLEMGTPIAQARWMTGLGIDLFRYFGDVAESYRYEELKERTDGGAAVIVSEPAGVAAIITPWNAPPLTSAMKVSAALAAGCTVILKPAPETPLDAYIMAECIDQAGLPPGVFNMVVADREVSDQLIRDPDVDKISFTGSTAVGRHIMATASSRIARVSLELGGKSPGIVLDDIAIDKVLPFLVSELTNNCGQACSSLTRIIVPRRRRYEIAEALAEAVKPYRIGNPFDPETQIGPLAMKRQLERVQHFIAKGTEEGAKLVAGGGTPAGLSQGYFIEPTIFVDVENDMTIAREEIFGPVSSIIAHDGPDDAVRIANDTIYGLHGGVFAEDVDQAYAIARRLRTGQVGCNSRKVIDAVIPMGGFRQSGIGRERGVKGFEAFIETKVLYMDKPLARHANGTSAQS